MAIIDHPPGAILRFGLRLPTWLFRLHLGWVLGERFLLLEHTGRKSGKPRSSVLEVVSHDTAAGSFYVVSGWGRKADWYRNIHKQPLVAVRVGGRRFAAKAEDVPKAQATDLMDEYARRHPVAFKELTEFFLSEHLEPGKDASGRIVEKMPMIVLQSFG